MTRVLYILRFRHEELIKIGFTIDVTERIYDLGEHFKTGARKGRGVFHLIGWPASWNTILNPKLTMSTFGFAGFTRCSGGAFSYDPTATEIQKKAA